MNNKLIRSLALLGLIGITATFSGCGTAAHHEDSTATQGITTLRNLDFKDYQTASENLITKLLASGRIQKDEAGQAPIIMVSEIRNSTAEHLDTQLLTQKITIALDKSQLARTTTAIHQQGEFDGASKQVRRLPDEELFDPTTLQKGRTLQAPRYSLAGEITELYRTSGRNRESYFQIYLTVTDLKTGLAIWQDANEILKQDKKPLISL